MAQHTNLTIRVAPNAFQALERALSRLASAPLPVAEGILAVRLVMMPTKSFVKPVLWLAFRQHSVLPGEWPWYGALDLHGESVALWQTWQTWQRENELGKVEDWDLHVMVKQSRKEVPGCVLLPRAEREYMAVPERQALEEREWEGREWERETLRLKLEEGGEWDWDAWARVCCARASKVRLAQAELAEVERAIMATGVAD